jgi:hypothetical protein
VTSAIDPTKPTDGVPASKADLRSNLQAAKDEIETLQAGKADVGHQHALVDISDAGALAGLNQVDTAQIADAAVTAAKIAVDAVGTDQLQDGIPINMQDQLLTRPELKDFSETSTTPAVDAGTLSLDLETGNVFDVLLTADVTSLNLLNAPASGRAGAATLIVRQDATGGRTVAWPGSVKWPGGAPPAASSAANAMDVYAFITRDGGVTWFGFLGGKDFS